MNKGTKELKKKLEVKVIENNKIVTDKITTYTGWLNVV